MLFAPGLCYWLSPPDNNRQALLLHLKASAVGGRSEYRLIIRKLIWCRKLISADEALTK